MVPISLEKYVEMYCENNPDENPIRLTESLKQAVLDKKNGATCSNCGDSMWAIGSAIAYQSCFSCLTGQGDSSKDYEIDEVCWA